MPFEEIKSFIGSIVSLSEDEMTEIVGYIEVKSIPKNSCFLEAGQICDSITCGSKIMAEVLT
jgi:hypothetical protein